MCLYPGLAEIARANGYALAVHGSLARDMDLIAVPWIESPSCPEQVIVAIETAYGIRRIGSLTPAAHGRLVQTIGIQFGECFIDLSFMPVAHVAAAKMVLPERLDLPHRDEFESADQYAAAVGETKKWNACLDEVASLNGLPE